MKTIAALILSTAFSISGCVSYGQSYPANETEGKKEPVDINRNGLPDNLERNAVPTAPIVKNPNKQE